MKFSYKNLYVLGDTAAATVTNLGHWKHVPTRTSQKEYNMGII
jgi:hypothetical protein